MSAALTYQVLGVVWGVVKYVIGVPIVNKALDHWTEGTSNQIDDMVWHWLEKMAGVPDEDKPSVIASSVSSLQAKYDELKKEGTLAAYKSSYKAWNSALEVSKTFPSSNIG